MDWDVEAEGFGSLGSSPGAGSRREPMQALPGEMIQEHSGGGDGCWFFLSQALDDFPICAHLQLVLTILFF